MKHELLAAIDLGSNSFRLQIARAQGDQIYPLDGFKEAVRLAAGLNDKKLLDAESQQRGLDALRLFGERLRGFDPTRVRAVATNTLRVAKNATSFLQKAEEALGFPIEVIAGREEARLIYIGIAHSIPNPGNQQLAVDIGGGSTEFIIGKKFQPKALESLYMGCVSYSNLYFPDGQIDKRGMKAAVLAARREIEIIAHDYSVLGWDEAVGSSGTAKAIADIIQLNGLGDGGLSDGAITRDGMEQLKQAMLRAGRLDALQLAGLRADRLPVLAGGLAIMIAVFEAFNLQRMTYADGALRLGVLYDLLGRYNHHDQRDTTVEAFQRRYEVERAQAERVTDTALALYQQLRPDADLNDDAEAHYLCWAARLHEIGVSIAHSGYHKHSAYILSNADMPGFSRMDQARITRLVQAHRGKLERVQQLHMEASDWQLVLCLRLSALLHRAREPQRNLKLDLHTTTQGFVLGVDADWLEANPLTFAALNDEIRQWKSIGIEFRLDMRVASRVA